MSFSPINFPLRTKTYIPVKAKWGKFSYTVLLGDFGGRLHEKRLLDGWTLKDENIKKKCNGKIGFILLKNSNNPGKSNVSKILISAERVVLVQVNNTKGRTAYCGHG